MIDRDWNDFKDNVVLKAKDDIKSFKGGRLEQFSQNWREMTRDTNIINMIENGIEIDFWKLPRQSTTPRPYQFSKEKREKIDRKIDHYVDKSIIEEVEHEDGEFISNIFSEDKSDGDIRVILDLTDLNEFVKDKHFKMETIEMVKRLIKQGCFMSSLDWKDAYYSVKVNENFRKYLKFYWRGKLYQFTCLPNGLKSAPRIFTKITKVVFSTARKQDVTASSYIDDAITIGDLILETKDNVRKLIAITDKAGFVTHPTKSELEPTQVKKHLGFMIDSVRMILSISKQRIEKIQTQSVKILQFANKHQSIRLKKLAQLVGSMISTLPANQYGRLDIRRVEKFLNKSLNQVSRDYSQFVKLNNVCIQDIMRWRMEIPWVFSPIVREVPQFKLQSDSSDIGWGGVVKTLGQDITTGGSWSQEEILKINNYLELKAAVFTIFSFCKNVMNKHIHISVDNKTAESYINKQGGRKPHLNVLARQLWKWAKNRKNWITASYLPGIDNQVADLLSRTVHDNLEWEVSKKLFLTLCNKFGIPNVDLFASRLNFKVQKYVSWKHDPKAWKTDAFSISWKGLRGYAFPPFNQIDRVLQKCRKEKAEIILICPLWTTQPWFTEINKIKNDNNYILFDREEVTHSLGSETVLPVKQFIALKIS